jgi:hypothetical protein
VISDFIKRFNYLPYNSQVIFLICGFGVVRLLLETIMDLSASQFDGLFLDVLLFGLLLAFMFTGWKKSFTNISPLFAIFITIILAYNFLRFGGAAGHSKFNYYAALYLITMVYTNRALYLTLGFNLGLLAVILIMDIASPGLLVPQSYPEYSTEAFWLTLVMLSFFTFYLKELTVSQGNRLSSLNSKMADQIREVRTINRMLETSNNQLLGIQNNLENEVNKRSEILRQKNQSIEGFIHVNNSDLIVAVEELAESMRYANIDSVYAGYFRESGKELHTVVQSIQSQLQEDPSLDRKIIRRHEDAH